MRKGYDKFNARETAKPTAKFTEIGDTKRLSLNCAVYSNYLQVYDRKMPGTYKGIVRMTLGYNAKLATIGIQLAKDEIGETGSIRVKYFQSGARITVTAFLKKYNIQIDKNKSYDITDDGDKSFLMIKLR